MADVKVYSTAMCPWCKKAKDYLKSKAVKFDELDVAADKSARDDMVKKSGQLGVPVIEINRKIIIGFDRNAIDAELAKG